MKKLSSILLICILAIAFGCTKDNPSDNGGNSSGNQDIPSATNVAPTCSITSPHEGDSFTENSQVVVNVVAEDSDGSISVVYLYIDNIGYQELTSFPYNFTIAGGYLTEGSHTLKAVAKDNDGAKAEASVTITISGPGGGTNGVYQVGDYYNRNGIEGIVYQISNGGTHGMIVSLDEGCEMWSSEQVVTNADDQYNGLSNTNLIKTNFDLNNYPAFKWCNNKNINGIFDWYFPSKTEMELIIHLKETLNVGILDNGGVIITTDSYWSSSEIITTNSYHMGEWAYYVEWSNSGIAYYSSSAQKKYYEKVRAVHSF